MHQTDLPTAADVDAAAKLLAPHIVRTPLLESEQLNAQLGCRLFVKAECLQRGGSFKIRGAMNHILKLAPDCPGVVAFSSGNHGQGVATAARHRNLPCVVLMPETAPAIKRRGVEFQGGRVIAYGPGDDRAAIAAELHARNGYVHVHPFDDRRVIAGNGTTGAEIVEQVAEAGAVLDAAVFPHGGGGLIAGCGLAIRARYPSASLFAVEPKGYDDFRQSLAAGIRTPHDGAGSTICDALLSPVTGERNFSLNRTMVTGALVVDDDEVAAAMRVAAAEFKLIVEPSGAAALAAILSGKLDVRGQNVAIAFTGGNIDLPRYGDLVSA